MARFFSYQSPGSRPRFGHVSADIALSRGGCRRAITMIAVGGAGVNLDWYPGRMQTIRFITQPATRTGDWIRCGRLRVNLRSKLVAVMGGPVAISDGEYRWLNANWPDEWGAFPLTEMWELGRREPFIFCTNGYRRLNGDAERELTTSSR